MKFDPKSGEFEPDESPKSRRRNQPLPTNYQAPVHSTGRRIVTRIACVVAIFLAIGIAIYGNVKAFAWEPIVFALIVIGVSLGTLLADGAQNNLKK